MSMCLILVSQNPLTLAFLLVQATGVDFKNLAIQKVVAASLCPTIQQHCTGSNQQYLSVATCVAELQLKPFGSFDEVSVFSLAPLIPLRSRHLTR
jgi:hypothetical protein